MIRQQTGKERITVSIAVNGTACRVHHPVDDITNVRIIFNDSSSLSLC